jgi:hypothetical protein
VYTPLSPTPQVYAWGLANFGALGLGDPSNIAAASPQERSPEKKEIIVATPQPVPGLFVRVPQ